MIRVLEACILASYIVQQIQGQTKPTKDGYGTTRDGSSSSSTSSSAPVGCATFDADASACDADPACRVLTGDSINPNLPLTQICVEIGTCDSDCALCSDADCEAGASRAYCLFAAPGFCLGVDCQLNCFECTLGDGTDCAASEAGPNGCVYTPGAFEECSPAASTAAPVGCATCGDCDADASACDADPACRVLTGLAINPDLPLTRVTRTALCVDIGTCDSDCALCSDADCEAASRANCWLGAPGVCIGVGCQLNCLDCHNLDDCVASEAEPNGCVNTTLFLPAPTLVCVASSVSVGDDDGSSSDDVDSIDVDSSDGISGAGGSNNDYAMDESRLLGMSESQTNVMYTLLVTGAFAVLAIAIGVWCFCRRSSSDRTARLSKRHRGRAQRLDTYDMDMDEEEEMGRTSAARAMEPEIEMENDVETKLNASLAAHGESDNL